MNRRMIELLGILALATSAVWAQTPRPGAGGGATAPTGQGIPAALGTGLILGQVVDGTSGQPVNDATVTLFAPNGGAAARGRGAAAVSGGTQFASAVGVQGLGTPANMLPGRGGPAGDRLLTDDHGRFVFHDLTAGSFSLQVSAPGYVSGAYGQSRPNGPSQSIALVEGQRIGDVKIRMWKLAALGGTVVDELGEPAVGVSVRAMRRASTNGRTQFATANAATTDDRGQFRIATLVPGDYVLALPETQVTMPVPIVQSMMDGILNGRGANMMDFVASGGPMPTPGGRRIGDNLLQSPGVAVAAPVIDGRVGVYLTQFYPSATAVSQATVVTLQSGEERSDLNLQLRVATTSVVTGTVLGPDGPLANAPVRLSALASEEASLGDEFASASTLTREDGSFTMIGVAPGQYIARVVKLPRPTIPTGRAGGGLGAMFLGDMSAPPTGPTVPLYGQAAVTVAGADVGSVSVQMREGAKVSGRVEFVGAAAAPQSQQLRNISITLNSLDGRNVSASPFAAGPPQPSVDANAQFKTQGYPPGRYSVVVGGSPSAPWTVKSAMANGRDLLAAPLELSTADIEGVVITYTDKSTRVSGAVRGLAAGSSATIVVFPADYKSWMANGMSQRFMRQVNPGTAGQWGAAGLPAGDYLAAAIDAADATDSQDSAWFDALARVATRLSLADGEARTVDLTIVRVK